MKKKNNLRFLITTGIIFILISFALIYSEIKGAKGFCDSIDGEYKFKVLSHLCNQETIFQYSDGWDFLRPDINDINFTLP